jgi:hypothetical protein
MITKDQIIEELESEIESLREENESLWFLLEELQNSDVSLFEKHISKALTDLKIKNMMTVSKAAEG